ncbi:actin-histidine N-methyltransferase [Phlebotomus argentipes]|uniref:actin-histidine N-methyltransferase n=1 Tax=Phlebotomus argentipes TaxID=94469 RepID=UPI0028930A69|nr:actin-histidine N-methyltransferase [Phlebotomus argentipes]
MGKGQKRSGAKKLPANKRNELNGLIDTLISHGFKTTTNLSEQWTQYLEIRSLLDRVQAIEAELKVKSASSKNRVACIEAFCAWARENGAQFDGVKISEFPGYGMGLEATKEFHEDAVFISIPKKMLMGLHNVSNAIAPMMSEMPMVQTMSNIKLAFSLLVERLNPNSFWKPYIDTLPEKYSTVMNFSTNEMQELKGSSALSSALVQCKNIARQYAFIRKYIDNIKEEGFDATLLTLKERFSFDLYCWAVSTVMTRQNLVPMHVTDKDEPQTHMSPALIPLWDMANHAHGKITTIYNAESDCIESSVQAKCQRGEQIFIFYGPRSNADFLIHNGFVYGKNEHDSVPIRLGLSSMDQLVSERTELLKALNIVVSGELSLLPAPQFISPELLGFVRVFNMSKEHLEHWLTNDRATDLLHADCALDTALEVKTWKFLETRLTLLLRSFPTTLEEDVALQSGPKLGHIRSILLQFRIGEKQILRDALEYVQQRVKS